MKNLGMYNNDLSIPRKKDIDNLGKQVSDLDTKVTVIESDVGQLEIDLGTAKQDITNLQGAVTTVQGRLDTIEAELPKKLTTPSGQQGQVLGFTADGNIAAIDVPVPEIDSNFNKVHTGAIPTAGWNTDANGSYYEVALTGVTADDCPIVFPQWTNKAAQQAAWNTLTGVEALADKVRFYAPKAFTIEVPYKIYYTVK